MTPMHRLLDKIRDDADLTARVWIGNNRCYVGVPSPDSDPGWLILETAQGPVVIGMGTITTVEAVDSKAQA